MERDCNGLMRLLAQTGLRLRTQGFFRVFQSGSRVRWDWEICVILVNLGIFTIVINLETVALHGSTLYLFVHYYKPEIPIFECPRYLWIKEDKLLKIVGASDWEILSTFWENTCLFSIGNGAEIRPQNSLEKSLKVKYAFQCGIRDHDIL